MNPAASPAPADSIGRLTRSWLPLYATWFMMSVEGPFLTAVIARLADPAFNLAAYGVAFSFALIIEAPVIMMLSASNALVGNWRSYLRLRNFTFVLSALVTAAMLLFILPPLFRFVVDDLMRLPARVARETWLATALMLPWPGAIGYRRFYQGLLVRNNATRLVAYGTVVRLGTMAIAALLAVATGALSGACVGTAALSAGVTAEAAASRWMAHRVLRRLRAAASPADPAPGYGAITRFYMPLALTSFISMAVTPIITFFLGQSRDAISSLAVLPVIGGLVFIFRSVGLAYQDIAIARLSTTPGSAPLLARFALLLGGCAAALLAAIAFTPLATLWFRSVAGLSPALADFSLLPLQILVPMAAASVLLSHQLAHLLHARSTAPVTWGTVVEVTAIVLVMIPAVRWLDLPGAVAAAIALILGRIVSSLYLMRPVRRAARAMAAAEDA